MLSANLLWKPSEGHQCVWIPTQLIFGPYILSVSSLLPLFCLFLLHCSTSCLYCSTPSSVFFSSSIVGLICHLPLMAHSICQASSLRFPSCSAFLISHSFLFVTDSDELEVQASTLFVDLRLWDMAGVYIYFFSIVVVIIIINIIMERCKQTEEAECCSPTGQFLDQRHNKGEESSPSSPHWISCPIISPQWLLPSAPTLLRHSLQVQPSSLFICCPHPHR